MQHYSVRRPESRGLRDGQQFTHSNLTQTKGLGLGAVNRVLRYLQSQNHRGGQ